MRLPLSYMLTHPFARTWSVPLVILTSSLFACSHESGKRDENVQDKGKVAVASITDEHVKPVVYQVFTRLFGNTNTNNKSWGTIEENGVGKFSDFTDEALQGIKELGVSHIWYTGVPHHDVITDYSEYGISNDDPDVVKGQSGLAIRGEGLLHG